MMVAPPKPVTKTRKIEELYSQAECMATIDKRNENKAICVVTCFTSKRPIVAEDHHAP